jgi:hypothetical protein
MNITEQLSLQIDRVIKKIADKFPASQEASVLTDVHFCVNQDTGEMTILDDDDTEITRCVVEQWIDDKSDDFYEQVAMIMRGELKKHADLLESMSILKPYAFVLENDDRDEQHELYVVDGDTIIVDTSDMMQNLEEDLDTFFANLMQDV